jgi:uncharacterized membrane protein YkoI
MKNQRFFLATMGSIALFAATSPPTFAYSGESMEKDAKVTLAQAKAIALGAEPGKIVDMELEKEAGGSGLRYSFDVMPADGGTKHEVGVDAQTGKLLENDIDTGND